VAASPSEQATQEHRIKSVLQMKSHMDDYLRSSTLMVDFPPTFVETQKFF
jgi:hypothetical protein